MEDVRDPAKFEETVAARRHAAPVLPQKALRGRKRGLYGSHDLLVRADALSGLFSSAFQFEEEADDGG